jgi:hypothetical protein
VGPQLVLTLAWLGVGMGTGTLLVLVNLLSRYDASRVSALLLLVPAVTAIASVPVLGEGAGPGDACRHGGLGGGGVGGYPQRPTARTARGRRARTALPGVTAPSHARVTTRGAGDEAPALA